MKIFKYLKSYRGFTIIESVLYMSLTAIIMALTSQVLLAQLDSYSTISQQQTTVSDIRYTLNRISGELLRLETEDIIAVSSTQLDYVDADGNTTLIGLSGNTIVRGEDTILDHVDNLTFTFLDSNSANTSNPEEVRQIMISIKSTDTGAGSYTLSTQVIPRNFMYANYE